LINFTPFPGLATKHLTLRQLRPSDADDIFFLRSDERVIKYLDAPVAKTIADAHDYIETINNGIRNNEWILWGIEYLHSPKVVGSICLWNIEQALLKAEIGYVLHPDFQGKGLIQEAMQRVIGYGFETLGLETIVAQLHPGNTRSIKALERTGFVYEKPFEEMIIYILTK
jgi:ribosomal-protein-alanine N-acetyltransferase